MEFYGGIFLLAQHVGESRIYEFNVGFKRFEHINTITGTNIGWSIFKDLNGATYGFLSRSDPMSTLYKFDLE